MADAPRRFPPPWRADRTPHGYVVRDADEQAIAYLLTRERSRGEGADGREARRIAVKRGCQSCSGSGLRHERRNEKPRRTQARG